MGDCPHCGKPIGPESVAVPDHALIEALKHPSTRTYGRGSKISKPTKPWLYAAADAFDSRKADFDRWFVTGPEDRKGYVKGPFPNEQVRRIAATGKLVIAARDESGRAAAYELKDPNP